MYVKPSGSPSSSGGASAVIYSFKNSFGQKQKVGVVYGSDHDRGHQVNQVFSGGPAKHHHHSQHAVANAVRPTPIPLPTVNQVI